MDAKIAGGNADQRAEMAAQAQEAATQAAAQADAAAHAQKAAEARQIADQAAMAAVERSEAERIKRAEEAEAATKRQEVAQADPGAEARRVLEEAEEIRTRAEAERERLEQLGNDYAERLKRERDRDRVAALRQMGAIAGVSDVQLLMIAPDVDPHTPGGRSELDKWREDNAGLFHQPQAPRPPSAPELLGSLKQKQSRNGHYGPEMFARILARNLERMK